MSTLNLESYQSEQHGGYLEANPQLARHKKQTQWSDLHPSTLGKFIDAYRLSPFMGVTFKELVESFDSSMTLAIETDSRPSASQT
jgi:hypothetical protein